MTIMPRQLSEVIVPSRISCTTGNTDRRTRSGKTQSSRVPISAPACQDRASAAPADPEEAGHSRSQLWAQNRCPATV